MDFEQLNRSRFEKMLKAWGGALDGGGSTGYPRDSVGALSDEGGSREWGDAYLTVELLVNRRGGQLRWLLEPIYRAAARDRLVTVQEVFKRRYGKGQLTLDERGAVKVWERRLDEFRKWGASEVFKAPPGDGRSARPRGVWPRSAAVQVISEEEKLGLLEAMRLRNQPS